MDVVSLQGLPTEFKVALLDKLGYTLDSDRVHVLHKDTRERVQDPYAKLEIRVDHMMVLPGSAILIDDNEFSLISYLEDKGDIL
ncbi:MAG: hypothetical protein L3J92_05120 [Thermoplasmata archaeon]|nr:hypothetical protein [Thermoplasmata archaeon]